MNRIPARIRLAAIIVGLVSGLSGVTACTAQPQPQESSSVGESQALLQIAGSHWTGQHLDLELDLLWSTQTTALTGTITYESKTLARGTNPCIGMKQSSGIVLVTCGSGDLALTGTITSNDFTLQFPEPAGLWQPVHMTRATR